MEKYQNFTSVYKIKNIPVNFWEVTFKNDTSYSLHMHEYFEFVYILEGHSTVIVNNKKYELCAGDLFFFNEGTPHELHDIAGTTKKILQFQTRTSLNNAEEILHRYLSINSKEAKHFKPETKIHELLLQCVHNISREHLSQEKCYDDFIFLEVNKMIAILRRFEILKNPTDIMKTQEIDRFYPVLSYIFENYDQAISIDKMAALINIDKFYFCKLFKKIFGTTFVDFVNFVRVSNSERLLFDTGYSMTEISAKVGFCSSAYFTKIFKKFKCCTPMQYRKYNTSI